MKFNSYSLSELASIKYGKNQKNVISEEGTIPIYGTGGLMAFATKPLYSKPSVLIGRKGSIGKVKYVNHPFWTVDTLFYTEINEDRILPKYLYYLMSLIDLNIYNEGTTIPSLRTETLNKLVFDIPSIENQRKILSFLSPLDYKIELNNRINENLEQQLRTIFERWFVFEAQDEWAEKKIGDFLRLERGLSYKGKFLSDDEGIPMLNLGNILPNSVFRPEKLKFYTGEFKSKVVVRPGDVIVANTDLTQAREVLGSAIRVPELDYPTIICSHHISIVKDCTISKNFVLGLLNLPTYRERVIGFATGTTVLALPNEALLNCTFKCPPDSLIKQYDRFADSYYSKIELLRKENKVLTEIRDSLLPRLMNGTINLEEVAQ